jgi:hypothetical protein
MMVEAIGNRPWFGYGWSDLGHAQVSVIDQFEGIGELYSQSHNLFLDLLAWNGIQLGLALCGLLLWWLWRSIRLVASAQDAVLVLAPLSVAIHAMLEYPLHYAYFLLPVGMFIGMLDVRLRARVVQTTPWRAAVTVWLVGILMLAATIRDYLHVEQSYTLLRFHQAGFRFADGAPFEPPELLALTQFEEWFDWARTPVGPGMSTRDLAAMEAMTMRVPSGGSMYRAASAFALNGQSEKARLWLGRICKIATATECRDFRAGWIERSRTEPHIAAVPWPED